jgi:hypothetical protein
VYDGMLWCAVNCVLCDGVLWWAVNCVLCDGMLWCAVNCVLCDGMLWWLGCADSLGDVLSLPLPSSSLGCVTSKKIRIFSLWKGAIVSGLYGIYVIDGQNKVLIKYCLTGTNSGTCTALACHPWAGGCGMYSGNSV